MSEPTIIKIDNVEYVRKDSISSVVNPDSPIRIVVLQRGWVMIGRYTEEGEKIILENASVIERWGTTKGLGELVTGPTKNTQLRYAGYVETHILGVILSISVEESKWSL